MSQSNKFSLGISINKSHLRKAGEEEWWEKTMESYISTNDYQCWIVILNGNGVVDLNKPEADWTPADYTTMEKNAKARQYLLNGLGRENKVLILTMLETCGMLSKRCMRAVMNSRPAGSSNFKVSIIPLK